VEPKPPREVVVLVELRMPDVVVELVRDGPDVLRNAVVGVMVDVRWLDE